MSILYHASFFLFLSLTAIAVIGSAAGLVAQAWLTGGQRRWDIVIVVGSYLVLAFTSILFTVNRLWSIRSALGTIPKAYIPVKEEDVPKKVYRLVEAEYTRASVVAYVTRPTGGVPPGWGAPGSEHENVYFPRALLDTVAPLDASARALLPSLQPLRPHVPIAQHFAPLMEIWKSSKFHQEVLEYDRLIQRARYHCADSSGGDEGIIGEAEWLQGVRLATELATIFNALSTLRRTAPDPKSRDFAMPSPGPVLDLLGETSLEEGPGSGTSSP